MFNHLREDISVVFDRDPAARTFFEVLTTYPGLHAILWHRMSHGLWNAGFKWLARLSSAFARWFTGIEIHPGASIGRRVFIDHGMGVVVGETAIVGDDCTLYHGVTLGGTSWNKGKRHPTLEAGVIIGAGAKILGPITLGPGAKVGSNAVVVKDVPAGATAIGIPARILDPELDKVREEAAKKLGFSAYAVSSDMNDPVAKAIHGLVDHSAMTDQRIEWIVAELKRLGGNSETGKTDDHFDPAYLNKIVD
ncbi:MAG: serine O-acetyltransferase [Pseudomonadota bacterium]|nr:serine O-acetyltransferase [Pseudomonadota bacterium]